MLKDTKLEEIKNHMYKLATTAGCDYAVEAAKAYAMLCIAQNNNINTENKKVATHNYIDGTRNAVFENHGVPTYKLTE